MEQLERIEAGSSASLLVRGDPGIGKTRLVAEVVERATERGFAVLTGRADDLDHGIPYAVFRDLAARLAPEASTALAVDELRAAIDGRGQPDANDEHVARMFTAMVGLVRAAAPDTPAVVVLEDVHVADRESVVLGGLLVRLADVPALMVVTTRPAGVAADLEEVCERMATDGRGAVIDLARLERPDIAALVEGLLDAPPDDALVDAVFAASAGNPFFAREVTQSFADGGALQLDSGRARLVPGAPVAQLKPSTALLRRLFGGTSADVELAKVVAVFGRFALRHLPLVERLTGASAAGVADSFDRLVKAGLLQESSGGYEFTHAIVRDTLYEDIGPAERRRIHAAIASELGTDRRAGIVLDALELATHVAASAEPGDQAAAEVLLEAGASIRSTAPLVSADYHRRAAELLPSSSTRRAEAQAMQASALHVGARPAEAASVGLDALAAMPEGAARRSTVALVVNDLYLTGAVGEALGVLDAEIAEGRDACPVLPMRTNLLLQAGRYDDAARQFDQADSSLDARGVTAADELMAVTHLAQYANHVGHVDAAAALLDRATALAERSTRTLARSAHELVAFADWRPGLLARIERHLERANALRPEGSPTSIGGSVETVQLRLWWMQGAWDRALEQGRAIALDLGQRRLATSEQLVLCALTEILVDRGDIDAATAVASRLGDPILASRRHGTLARARLRHAVGDLDGARSLLLAERDEAQRAGGSVWKLAEVLRELVDIEREAGRGLDAATAAQLAELAARTGWLESTVAALAARATADRDVDVARAYAELTSAEGWVAEHARALLLLGELDDDPKRNLAEAYRTFDSMGAAPWRRRAAAGLRNRGLSVPRRAVGGSSVLTETEEQLVRLVHDGLSNRQIAAAMHYSMKTIEVYLSRVYAKTGCSSRLELIRAVDAGTVDVGEV